MAERTAVVAIGGNSLVDAPSGRRGPDRSLVVAETCRHIASMIKDGWRVVITHGNGPQVGILLRRSELTASELGEEPLDTVGAETQGAIGYVLQRNLENEFRSIGLDKRAVAVVTQTEVDADDPAFRAPSKPVGAFMDEATARRHEREDGWAVGEDAGRGWRRLVASPAPLRIVEADAVASLVDAGFVVIAVGGGGIPVARDDSGTLRGVPAVIDKDLASSLLATALEAELLVISTVVDRVALDWGTPDQRFVDRMTLTEARQRLAEGRHFAVGSMRPKMQAVIGFLERGGTRAIVTNPANLERAVAGEAGTHVVPD